MTDHPDKHLGYIRDLAHLLREQIVEAAAKAKSGSTFDEGRAFGLREALAWMQHQTIAFDIAREDVALDGFDAMTDPVDPPPRKGW